MTTFRRFAPFLLPIFLLASACSSSSSEPPFASGIDGSKRLVELTEQETKTLCDWTATYSGGYGHEKGCDSGASGRVCRDQAACVSAQAGVPKSCTWTIAQSEACTRALARDPCTSITPTECKAPAECNLAGGLC